MSPQIPLGFLNVEETKISPNVLLIIVILAAIFFISGLLHLLVRLLFRASNIDSEDTGNVTAFQGQLQQLFHLHDAGVDQSFIDTLPVFLYKAIIGAKNTLDCAVCLCEFEAEDKLRLLPKCSHAFHTECIDTWLLSHSTCPLCRSNLLPDCPPRSSCAPIVLVLESGSESSREIAFDRDTVGSTMSSVRSSITRLSFHGEEEFGSSCKNETQVFAGLSEANVVPLKLGKFKSVVDCREGGEGSSSTSNVDGRRCFSMGSYEYVLDDSSILQVAVKPASRKANGKKLTLPLIPGHRPAMSECDCHSSRDVFKGFEAEKSTEFHVDVGSSVGNSASAASVGGNRRESFSISKIWLRSKDKASTADSSNRTLSFRFPLQQTATGESKPKCSMERTVSEINYTGSESGLDVELGRTMSLESCPTSFTRRTLLRLAGKQNKIVHSSSTLPV